MKKKKSDKTNNSDLRNKAEKALNADAQPIDKLPDEEVRKLALELQVHQIELEMQNEELRNAHVELNKSHDEYISLYDFAPVGYLTISEKGLILRANLKFASMLCMER
ncbi:MAG: diguanylate cyclase, partial [Candidatus Scalindua sp.]|nr:diguanylate cyclase [Candidatus Scalindua sp.]